MFPDSLTLTQNSTYILHFDVDFFTSLYKGEIKTPIYNILYNFLSELKGKGLNAYMATVAQSNYGDKLPLKFRFLGSNIAGILNNPEILDAEIPKTWALRSEILYLENFFQPKEILNLASRMVQLDEKNPAAHFDLYKALNLNKEESSATLDAAITLDAVYALEYLSQARLAHNNNQPLKEITYLQKALLNFPDDPIIMLRLAQALKERGKSSEAESLLGSLRAQEWSEIYYPNIESQLAN